jgi:hypothetical protein
MKAATWTISVGMSPCYRAALVMVAGLSIAVVWGILAVPTLAVAGHPQGAGCPHEHPEGDRTSSTCTQRGPKTCTTGCQQQRQCNCRATLASAAEGTAQDLRTNVTALLAASMIPGIGSTLVCGKLSSLTPLFTGWRETLDNYSSSPECPAGMGYVSSDFLNNVDSTLKDLPTIRSHAIGCGLSSLVSELSSLQSKLLAGQVCHLLGVPGQLEGS